MLWGRFEAISGLFASSDSIFNNILQYVWAHWKARCEQVWRNALADKYRMEHGLLRLLLLHVLPADTCILYGQELDYFGMK